MRWGPADGVGRPRSVGRTAPATPAAAQWSVNGSLERVHGSSESQEMLKRNDKYHSIADEVPIPIFFPNRSMAFFQKLHFCVRHDIFFVSGLVKCLFTRRQAFSSPTE